MNGISGCRDDYIRELLARQKEGGVEGKPIGIKLTAASCLKRVAWRELPPQKGIFSSLPAFSWPYLVKSKLR